MYLNIYYKILFKDLFIRIIIITKMPTNTTDSSNNEPEDSVIHQGVCKWFNNKRGYGFITVVSSENSEGEDIFVHQTNIKPLNSTYRTLSQGEYIQFNMGECDQGKQAVNVKGINNGPLMCDNFISNRQYNTRNTTNNLQQHRSNNSSNTRSNRNNRNNETSE